MKDASQLLELAPNTLLQDVVREPAPPRGAEIVAAVSGGADSVAMLHLLFALARGRGWSITVATYDHGLRADSSADAEFVESLAARLSLRFFIERGTPSARWSEDRARRQRYAFLERVLDERSAAAIALAHTCDDQAETLLFRLARGSGLRGAASMTRLRASRWRPLLDTRREVLRTFLEHAGIVWREDPTNRELDRARNRIRHGVLPLLEQATNTSAVDSLARFARLAGEDEELLNKLAQRESERLTLSQSADHWTCDRHELNAVPAPLARRVVHQQLARLVGAERRIAAIHIEDLMRLSAARSSGIHVDLPGELSAKRVEGSRIELRRDRR